MSSLVQGLELLQTQEGEAEGFKEGKIDSFPFLQGIEELLNNPSRNLVIEEVFRGGINKAMEKGEVNDRQPE